MASSLNSLTNYAEYAFPDLDLGDKRLDRRFAQVIQSSLQHPEKALPDKFHDPAAYFACLRLLNHPAVTHGKLLCCHQTAVLDRLECLGPAVVLLVHQQFTASRKLSSAIDLWRFTHPGPTMRRLSR